MKVSIVCSSESHPVNEWLIEWIRSNSLSHDISLVRNKKDLIGGDILFLISCSEIINATDWNKFKKSLVIHASDLPFGRGWSPHVWQILEGKTDLTVTLLEADEKVDSGRIWVKKKVFIPKTALFDEINATIFNVELSLMDFAIENFYNIVPIEQDPDLVPNYYSKRTPKDSEIDIRRNIEDQFDLIRVCDPKRFPSYFIMNGQKYKLTIERMKDE